MQEIKFCPYCEGKHFDILVSFNSELGITKCVKCRHCGACGPLAEDDEEAILKWNSRIQEAPEMQEERPQIIDRYNARNFICPFTRTKEYGCSALCMAWVSVGEDKGRCGLVNTPFAVSMCAPSCEA